MSTFTVSGPLRYCKCGHGEFAHFSLLFQCDHCDCLNLQRSRSRRASRVPLPTETGEK